MTANKDDTNPPAGGTLLTPELFDQISRREREQGRQEGAILQELGHLNKGQDRITLLLHEMEKQATADRSLLSGVVASADENRRDIAVLFKQVEDATRERSLMKEVQAQAYAEFRAEFSKWTGIGIVVGAIMGSIMAVLIPYLFNIAVG